MMNNPLLNVTPLGTHTGFTQLAIIYKKQKDWEKVIELCKQAKADDWGGDWDKRIEEAQKHLN